MSLVSANTPYVRTYSFADGCLALCVEVADGHFVQCTSPPFCTVLLITSVTPSIVMSIRRVLRTAFRIETSADPAQILACVVELVAVLVVYHPVLRDVVTLPNNTLGRDFEPMYT
jgi:hypothetical protein